MRSSKVFSQMSKQEEEGWLNVQNAVNGITRNMLKFQKMCGSNQIANGFAKTAAVPLSSF